MLEADSEDTEFAVASAWDDLSDWQGLEVFDSTGLRFVAARAFRLRPKGLLGLWIARLVRSSVRVGFEWGAPSPVSPLELRRRLATVYPDVDFASTASNHEALIRRCL